MCLESKSVGFFYILYIYKIYYVLFCLNQLKIMIIGFVIFIYIFFYILCLIYIFLCMVLKKIICDLCKGFFVCYIIVIQLYVCFVE